MKVVVQKVNHCTLSVDGEVKAHIDKGLLVTVGVNRYDTDDDVQYLARKISHMRIWKDENNKINRSVLDEDGEVMVVSNFTLQAVIGSGTRPSFSHGAEPTTANELYLNLYDAFKKQGVRKVEHGCFGQHMHLETLLDGPYTLILDTDHQQNSAVKSS